MRTLRNAGGRRPLGLLSVEILLHLCRDGPLDVPQLEHRTKAHRGSLYRAYRPFLPLWDQGTERVEEPRVPLMFRRLMPGSRRRHRYFLSAQGLELMEACSMPVHPGHQRE